MDQQIKLSQAKDKILIYTVSKIQPHIRYILRLAKAWVLKIEKAKDKILIYIVSKIKPHILYILGYMIPLS